MQISDFVRTGPNLLKANVFKHTDFIILIPLNKFKHSICVINNLTN